jgi:hypothetical protein
MLRIVHRNIQYFLLITLKKTNCDYSSEHWPLFSSTKIFFTYIAIIKKSSWNIREKI